MPEKRIMNLVTSRPDASNPNKKHWSQHGILIIAINEHGEERISIKLNSFPIGAEFDGWFSVFPKEEDTGSNTRTHSTRTQPRQHTAINTDDYDETIPFH